MAMRNVLQDSCYSNLSVLSVNNNDLGNSRPENDQNENGGARSNNGQDFDAQSNHSNQEGAQDPGSHRSMNNQEGS